MPPAPIDWTRFDRIYCFHYLPQTRKWDRLAAELERVGICGERLSMRYTFPSRYDAVVFDHANDGRVAVNAGCVNLGYAALGVLEEALACGHRRILVLENDVAFLKNPAEIEATLAAMPPDADIWQMDNFVVPGGEEQYRRIKASRREGPRFFNASGATFYSGACFALSRNGMEAMRTILRGALQPPDSCFVKMETMGLKRVVADENIAIQLVYGGSVSADLWGVKSHHDGYMRGDVDYSRYNLPDGYRYGSAL